MIDESQKTALLVQRNEYRKQGNYKDADRIRDELLSYGFQIIDTPEGSSLVSLQETENSQERDAYLVLFGSGSTTTNGRQIHEYVFRQINKKSINVVIISTPAGFQPNVKIVEEEIATFFQEHLTNFHPNVTIVYANNSDMANDPNIISPLDDADYIVVGAGSPTYTVKHIKNTLLQKKIIERVQMGTSLCLASAAVLAFSHKTLPVYEIYKVGEDLHWIDGLDLYKEFIHPNLTVIPHFSNAEGGVKTDTSCCYIGRDRFEKVLQLLSPEEKVWGIDENTGVIFNLKNKSKQVMGLGQLHEDLKK